MADLPKPPRGLLGVPSLAPTSDDVMTMLQLGADYAEAAADGKRQAMVRIYDRADQFYNGLAKKGARAALQEEHERREEAHRAAEERRAAIEPRVYFIQCGDGAIKIGFAGDVHKRLRALQTSHPEPLSLLVHVAGGRELEARYHRKFKKERLAGEWFMPTPRLLAEVERLRA